MSTESHALANEVPKRVLGVVGALLVIVGLCLCLATGPISAANAEANYRCTLPGGGTCEEPVSEAGPHEYFYIFNYERAGCIRTIGYYGEPQSEWHCYGKGAETGFYRPDPSGGYNRSALKNNTVNTWANYSAAVWP